MQVVSVEQALELSKRFFVEDRYETAVEVLLKILVARQECQEALRLLGLSFYKDGRPGLAAAAFEKLVATGPPSGKDAETLMTLYRSMISEMNVARFCRGTGRDTVDAGKPRGGDRRIVVLCAGQSSRWNAHLGVANKHLVPVEGERLLCRTLRLVERYEPSSAVVLVGAGKSGDYKRVVPDWAEIEEVPPRDAAHWTPAWKYLSSEPFLVDRADTILLLGDVWFSEAAVERIFSVPQEDWMAYGRHHASSHTGCPYGELFALRFSDTSKHLRALHLLDRLYLAGVCRNHASGWALLQTVNGGHPNIRAPEKGFVTIDDFTEDFDYPADYDRWTRRYSDHQRRLHRPDTD